MTEKQTKDLEFAKEFLSQAFNDLIVGEKLDLTIDNSFIFALNGKVSLSPCEMFVDTTVGNEKVAGFRINILNELGEKIFQEDAPHLEIAIELFLNKVLNHKCYLYLKTKKITFGSYCPNIEFVC